MRTVATAAAALLAMMGAAAAPDRILVGDAASRCDWELIPYETVDGIKGHK